LTASAPPPAARRPAWFRAAAAAASIAATIGVLEAVLAAAGLPRRPALVGGVTQFADARVYDSDPKLLWRLHRRANLDFPELWFVGVRTDSRGLRGADRDEEWKKSRLRVLCLGDSVTFGVALANDETFPARLERALVERLPPETAPVVINAGVPGYSSVQGLRLLDELAPLEPDVVVWWFGMNDAKAALGGPDSELRPPAPRADGETGPLGGLRTLRFAASIAESLRGDAPRVSVEEVRATVAELARRSESGGPATLIVRCPSRLDEKLAQLESIASVVRACDAPRVEGANDALSQYVVGPPGCDLVKSVRSGPDGAVAVLGEGNYGRVEIDVDELARRREAVARWKRGVDAYVAQMPPDAVGFRELFGDSPPAEVLSDNCHMTADGARRAAASVASRIAELVARRARPPR
jgi:lysophospholipase L1-like esterase